jgi:hypothetical protein
MQAHDRDLLKQCSTAVGDLFEPWDFIDSDVIRCPVSTYSGTSIFKWFPFY